MGYMLKINTDNLIGVAGATKELGVKTDRVRQLLRQGRIKGAFKVDDRWIIPKPVEVTGPSRPVGRPARNGDNDKH